MPKARYKSLRLREISAVDNPAQEGARMVIMKRNDPLLRDILKYVDNDEGAKTFSEVIGEIKFNQDLWPMLDALSTSIRSIVSTKELTLADKQEKIKVSVTEFLASVREKAPEAEAELSKVVKGLASGEITPARKGDPMPGENKEVDDLKKSVADLTTKVGELTTQNAELQVDAALTDADKEHVKTLDAEAAKAFKKKAPAERAQVITATKGADESITVDGQEIRKSVVGAGMFAVMKSQQARLTANEEEVRKANERAEAAEFKKQAGADYPHLTGDEDTKVEILRAMKGMPQKARDGLTAIMKAAEAMVASGFTRSGNDGTQPADVAKASGAFMTRVADIQKRDSIPRSAAMAKAKVEAPAEFEAYQEVGNVEYIPPATRKANAKR